MAAQTAWPHSTLEKKKEQSLSVSIIPFDLSMHTFFFLFVMIDAYFGCRVTAVIKRSFHYRFTSPRALCAVTCG